MIFTLAISCSLSAQLLFIFPRVHRAQVVVIEAQNPAGALDGAGVAAAEVVRRIEDRHILEPGENAVGEPGEDPCSTKGTWTSASDLR